MVHNKCMLRLRKSAKCCSWRRRVQLPGTGACSGAVHVDGFIDIVAVKDSIRVSSSGSFRK